MRPRTSAAAVALGALALVVPLASPASAAEGDFHYRYTGLNGQPQPGVLVDPPSQRCVVIPEAANPGSSSPAFGPRNDTGSVAIVYTEPDCTGQSFRLRPHGEQTTDRLQLRSVIFS
ncbi:hypothetical protein [Streptomyces sp. NBC_00690]|uniref:hypothetical protein n=1 Tax=Streptomyces sp. NBC_00690 TaxID=2975808 RepID=UPI002E2B9098|nr:hypothetical protein [Streptomyces sp. NBC_00690]